MGLNIIICVKSVILHTPKKQVNRSKNVCALNPFDRPVIELALQLRDREKGTVTAISMGPESAEPALLEAMAMGVDRGVLICDPAIAGSDTLATSTTLGAAINKLTPFDLVLYGTRSSDSDSGQAGPQTSTLLDIPFISNATSIRKDNDTLTIERQTDGFIDVFEATAPVAATIRPNAVQPRDVALAGIEAIFAQNTITRWNIKDIGLTPEQTGENGSQTKVVSMKPVKNKRRCEFIEGQIAEQAEIVLQHLTQSGFLE